MEVPEKEGGDSSVTALAMTPDQKTVLAGTHRGVVHRLDLATGRNYRRSAATRVGHRPALRRSRARHWSRPGGATRSSAPTSPPASPSPMRAGMWGLCTWTARRTASSSPRRIPQGRVESTRCDAGRASAYSRRRASRPRPRSRSRRTAAPGDRPRGCGSALWEPAPGSSSARSTSASHKGAGDVFHDLAFGMRWPSL